jgi:hypothetical protein
MTFLCNAVFLLHRTKNHAIGRFNTRKALPSAPSPLAGHETGAGRFAEGGGSL